MIRLTPDGQAIIWWQSAALTNYKWEIPLDAYLAFVKCEPSLESLKASVCNVAKMTPLTEQDIAELRGQGVLKGTARQQPKTMAKAVAQ